ncbi:MAG: hypothetical protein RLZZ271_986 [Pseudomonadota bacterium]|jgi:hypothetical protein
MSDARAYLRGFVIGATVVALPFLMAFFLLKYIGEIGIDFVIKRQLESQSGDILFLSGLNQDFLDYKLNLAKKRSSEIVALGSSRAMQVREQFFNGSFTNMGGAIGSAAGLQLLANQIGLQKAIHPKTAILFIDPWWFNKKDAGIFLTTPELPKFPDMISVSIFSGAVKAFARDTLQNQG